MSHGSVRIGSIEIVALCDGVLPSEDSLAASFPRVPDDAWPRLLEQHPETVTDDGRWLLHDHCYLIRASGRTILFDAGFGPATAPAFSWSGTEGRLLEELAEAGVGLAHVETVLVSHVHDDHLGWLATADGRPRFPNARYVVNRADIDALRGDAEDPELFAATIAPLERAGVLDASEDRMDVAPGVELLHAPGHTPGHQVLLVEDGDDRAILSADTTNHPAMIEDPTWSGTTDGDMELAAETRASLLGRAEREQRVWITTHFADPFVRIVTEGDRRRDVALDR
jgi:glyoxylase-like metal-dependent hydrolase (beta-lactamase superfamily II)